MGKGFRVTIKSYNSEVTGSCFMIKIKRPGKPYKRIVVDGGLIQGQDQSLNYILDFDPSEVEALIVTHNHLDHTGKIPMFVKEGFKGYIYCTYQSKESIPIGWKDTLKIMQHEKDLYGKKMLYNLTDVETATSMLFGLKYSHTIQIATDVKLTLLGNGHLYGAAMVLLQISCQKYEQKNILFTGDYYFENELFDAEELPEYVKNLPNLTIIQESTYGNISKETMVPKLKNYVFSSLEAGKNILMPVISQERLELVLLELKKMQEEKLLNKAIKIFIHTPLGVEYLNKIYLNNPEIHDFMPDNACIVPKEDFETVLEHTGQKIILSSSGMADQGVVRFYLKDILYRTDYSIIFTCFTVKGTLGYRLKNSPKGAYFQIDDKTVPLRCDVMHTSELSRHIKYEDIVYFLNQFPYLKNILLTHGEIKAKNYLYGSLKKETSLKDKNIHIMNRDTGFKIDPNMDIEPYPTNLVTPTSIEYITKEKTHKKNKDKIKKKQKNNNKK